MFTCVLALIPPQMYYRTYFYHHNKISIQLMKNNMNAIYMIVHFSLPPTRPHSRIPLFIDIGLKMVKPWNIYCIPVVNCSEQTRVIRIPQRRRTCLAGVNGLGTQASAVLTHNSFSLLICWRLPTLSSHLKFIVWAWRSNLHPRCFLPSPGIERH